MSNPEFGPSPEEMGIVTPEESEMPQEQEQVVPKQFGSLSTAEKVKAICTVSGEPITKMQAMELAGIDPSQLSSEDQVAIDQVLGQPDTDGRYYFPDQESVNPEIDWGSVKDQSLFVMLGHMKGAMPNSRVVEDVLGKLSERIGRDSSTLASTEVEEPNIGGHTSPSSPEHDQTEAK